MERNNSHPYYIVHYSWRRYQNEADYLIKQRGKRKQHGEDSVSNRCRVVDTFFFVFYYVTLRYNYCSIDKCFLVIQNCISGYF